MTRSPLVFAADGGSSRAVPDCVADATHLCAQGGERFELDRPADFRTPMSLPAGLSGRATGSR